MFKEIISTHNGMWWLNMKNVFMHFNSCDLLNEADLLTILEILRNKNPSRIPIVLLAPNWLTSMATIWKCYPNIDNYLTMLLFPVPIIVRCYLLYQLLLTLDLTIDTLSVKEVKSPLVQIMRLSKTSWITLTNSMQPVINSLRWTAV